MQSSRYLQNGLWALMSGCVTVFFLLIGLYFYVVLYLPDVTHLEQLQLQAPLRIYTRQGQLIREFGQKRRVPVAYKEVPKPLIWAILATEDQRFFTHPGVDFIGLVRAAKQLWLTGKKTQGASTITMQVARNFFLTRKKTFTRKINEILLALKMDSALSKTKILELYLNKIFLGQRAYGVAAAAQVYYGKSLDALTLPQLATIAGLPRAPSRDNPITNSVAAKKRRNHVLRRMSELGFIDQDTYLLAARAPMTARYHGRDVTLKAPYVAEMVRVALVEKEGLSVYTRGLRVYTTIDGALQRSARQSLRKGMLRYDVRHGYRGPERKVPAWLEGDTSEILALLKKIPVVAGLAPALVTQVNVDSVVALLKDGQNIVVPWSGLVWARPQRPDGHLGPVPQEARDIVHRGDVIRVYHNAQTGQWVLRQLPQVQGALVALDVDSGAVLALRGGFSYTLSHFNRVYQAWRQPGSCFKPFIYAAALDKGYSLATLVNDAPIVLPDSGENRLWRPQNHTFEFYGPTRLRVGLVQSRNLVSVRILRDIGVDYMLDYIRHFHFDAQKQPHALSLALGSGLVTPLQLTAGYAVFANGGYSVAPYLIERIEDARGHVLYQKPPVPMVRTRSVPEETAYLINNVLQDVIRTGTGRRALVLHRKDLAGKTGTTNDQMDAWFSGYGGHVVSSVWLGFDQQQSVRAYGSQIALPVWIDFMQAALKGDPERRWNAPEGVVSARIDPKSGLLAYPGQKHALTEWFRDGQVPQRVARAPQQSPSDEFGRMLGASSATSGVAAVGGGHDTNADRAANNAGVVSNPVSAAQLF